jgi:cyclopropane fatty-acyl-phospholipid synthase-like methyltransferase
MTSQGVVEHDRDWWAYQFRVVHRSGTPGIEAWDNHLIAFIVEVLGLERGARVLDVGCGSGVHGLALAGRGMEVVGLDIAPSLVRHCREQAETRGLRNATFVVGDMRDLASISTVSGLFDAVLMLSTSFGFFDDATNQLVLNAIPAKLHEGGSVLLQLMDPLRFLECQRRGVFQEERPEGSYWEETWFDPATFTSHTRFRFTDSDGVLHLWNDLERIRVYTLPELRGMMKSAGLSPVRAYGDVALPPRPYGVDCSNQLIVAGWRTEREQGPD